MTTCNCLTKTPEPRFHKKDCPVYMQDLLYKTIYYQEANKLFDRAIKAWGVETQLDMLQEECAELIQAISKKKRGYKNGDQQIAEEIADVEILTAQIKRMYSLNDDVEDVKTHKLHRLRLRLEDAENGNCSVLFGEPKKKENSK